MYKFQSLYELTFEKPFKDFKIKKPDDFRQFMMTEYVSPSLLKSLYNDYIYHFNWETDNDFGFLVLVYDEDDEDFRSMWNEDLVEVEYK